MFNGSVDVTSGVDLTDEVKRELEELSKLQVYVGIPEGGNERSEGISNAELLYVHTHGVRQKVMRDVMNPVVESGEMTYSQAYAMWLLAHGSPLWASPPRPVIEPAIEHSQDMIARQLRKVIDTVLEGKDPMPELIAAGELGQEIARQWFVHPDNGWAPNSSITIEGSAPDKDGNKFIKGKGSDRPLIDTGELRGAITYVISEGGDAG